jgi:hypothetical protein
MPIDNQRQVRQAPPDPGPLKPPHRNILGACLVLLALATMSLVVLLLFKELGSPVFAIKFEEGDYPPNSEALVHSARVGVIASTGLIVVSTGLSASAVAVRPHPLLQLVAALTLVALIPVLLLLWLGYGLAF